MQINHCHHGDCRDVMRQLIAGGIRVQTIITSPPYYGLRDYGVAGQIGLEPTMQEYIANMVEVFDVARELLADDGTLWLNLGDSYASSGRGGNPTEETSGLQGGQATQRASMARKQKPDVGLKPKDLCGIPWRIAFALQESGWTLRQDIIWSKPNPMPESVKDRCTKAHEYIFLMSKSPRYYFDADAIKEPASYNTHERQSRAAMSHKTMPDEMKNGIRPRSAYKTPDGWDTSKGDGGHGSFHKDGREKGRKPAASWNGSTFDGPRDLAVRPNTGRKMAEAGSGIKNNDSFDAAMAVMPDFRNKRSVWTVASQPFKDAHFATFPPALIEPCILAGSRPGDIVFDPFMGSGTVAQVAQKLGRRWLGAELNPEYIQLQAARTQQSALILEQTE